ncbi:PglZ domain-containing protein [Nostoc sp. XA010]|uniref:PglZ domain-containing protein n=1 Tax=Nostoc sp. XA010 TaxID=2780407 RepID=UPI001E46B09A|nr:PglZ domain-containing protein [Nostoc sp. XA010]MCC5662126.1 PglZ domain-containing protein [Nostoc sp. XA010]
MVIVTNYLCKLITKQIDDNGIVVWYDPDRHYTEIVHTLSIHNTTVTCYSDTFFGLRHKIDHLLDDLNPPRLLIYVPIDPIETNNALVELEAAGVIMKPGQQPPSRNTKLSVVARNALKPILGDDTTAIIEKQVEAGKLTLAELNAIAEKGEGITQGVVITIFGTGNPQEVALTFLASENYDRAIISKSASQELAVLLQSTFEIQLPAEESPSSYRVRLARHILATEFINLIQGDIPNQLSSIQIATKSATRDACINLAKTWRLRRDLKESYINHANQVETELAIASLDLQQHQIANLETFLAVEKTLQRLIETTLLTDVNLQIDEIIKSRQSSFWSENYPDVQAHWALTAVAGQLLQEANRIERELKSPAADVQTIFNAYTDTETPWCVLDTYHRHLERRWHDFEWGLHDRYQSLEKLVNQARNRYMNVGSQLAEAFVRRYEAAKFRLPGIMRQTEVFIKAVKPKLAEGKTAYVWVDALRYEMAWELSQTLREDYNLEIQAAIATVPTITEIGMAAFLPGAETSATVVTAGDSKLGLEINGTVVKDRPGRIKFLQDNTGVNVFVTKLGDLLPKPKRKERESIQQAKLILVTSQEIDSIGEGDNVRLARRTMDEILNELKKAFRVLTELGVETIIFAADHGYLFGEELTEDMKIDSPGGDTADLHRRVWVGKGGRADTAFLRAKLSDFGLGGDLEIATPWNFACFKVKGGTEAYFHGGLSPQELIIPVVTLIPKQNISVGITSEISWTIEPGSQKISTRFFSVTIKGDATGIFELVPPKVRVEVRVKKDCISQPATASYGFEEATGDVQLQKKADNPRAIESNTVALMITQDQPAKTVASVHLLDAVSGAELARISKIEIAIAI